MLRTKKPLVGVLAARMQSDLDTLDKVATSYTSAIHKAGGIPVILTNIPELMEDYTELIDALVLIGGTSDVDPSLYGEKNVASNDLDPQKDRMEQDLIQQCIEKSMPILGICRGMQSLNVYFGGSLIQDMSKDPIDHLQYPKQNKLVHKIKVEGSKLFKDGDYEVNSVHHQSVSKLGDHLKVTAVSPDGIIEMIEHENLPIIAVQWHPECLPKDELSEKLFSHFIGLSKISKLN